MRRFLWFILGRVRRPHRLRHNIESMECFDTCASSLRPLNLNDLQSKVGKFDNTNFINYVDTGRSLSEYKCKASQIPLW